MSHHSTTELSQEIKTGFEGHALSIFFHLKSLIDLTLQNAELHTIASHLLRVPVFIRTVAKDQSFASRRDSITVATANLFVSAFNSCNCVVKIIISSKVSIPNQL
jgi:hypothetical protein